MKSVKIILSVLCLFAFGAMFGGTAGFNPVVSGFTLAIGLPIGVVGVTYFVKLFAPGFEFGSMTGMALVGVNKEIWLDLIMERFYPDGSWIKRLRDFSEFVKNDVINLADCGADPTVLVNNTSDVAINGRTDTAVALTLDTLDTENTKVTNVEMMETQYDKMASVIRQHQNALQTAHHNRSAWSIAPSSNSTATPVILATGTADGTTGLKAIKLADLLTLQKKFNDQDLPLENRCLLLCPQHLQDLLNENITLNNQYVNLPEGKAMRYAGFDLYVYTAMPLYTKSGTPTKVAYGTTYVALTHSNAVSVAFVGTEAFNADGSMDMFYMSQDPIKRADYVGFQKRSLAGSIRGKGVAAIVSSNV